MLEQKSHLNSFYFDNDKDVILPLDFFNGYPKSNTPEIVLLLEEKKYLSSIDEDIITHKQYLRLEELETSLKSKDINNKGFQTRPYRNKYGFYCLETNDYFVAEKFIKSDCNLNFALYYEKGKEVVKTLSEEDYTILFDKTDNGYVLRCLLGNKTHFSWVKEKFNDLIKNLKLPVKLIEGEKCI